jgi:hypothetical protein
MSDIFQKLHGTTVDRFQIGRKVQTVTLTGTNTAADTVNLVDRDGNGYTADSTVFFTAYVIGTATDTAAYEIKGCYISGISGVSGYVVNTYVDSNSFTPPSINFNNSGVMTVSCTGLTGQNVVWTATIDIVKI